jgi:hypothetical protein
LIAINREKLENTCGGFMKNLKTIAVKEVEIKRPPKAKISEKEALKRMEKLVERKEQFIAIVRTGKSGSVSS